VFYDRFNHLCEQSGKKPTPVILELGLSRGNLQKWKAGASVNSDILIMLADYFNVSIDYLLCRTDNPEINK